jgi:hypothetical protein
MTGAKPPLKKKDQVEKLVDAMTGAGRTSIFGYDKGHVTLADEAKQRLHVMNDCRLLPDLMKTGSWN